MQPHVCITKMSSFLSKKRLYYDKEPTYDDGGNQGYPAVQCPGSWLTATFGHNEETVKFCVSICPQANRGLG